jgi:hypothetical protein
MSRETRVYMENSENPVEDNQGDTNVGRNPPWVDERASDGSGPQSKIMKPIRDHE